MGEYMGTAGIMMMRRAVSLLLVILLIAAGPALADRRRGGNERNDAVVDPLGLDWDEASFAMQDDFEVPVSFLQEAERAQATMGERLQVTNRLPYTSSHVSWQNVAGSDPTMHEPMGANSKGDPVRRPADHSLLEERSRAEKYRTHSSPRMFGPDAEQQLLKKYVNDALTSVDENEVEYYVHQALKKTDNLDDESLDYSESRDTSFFQQASSSEGAEGVAAMLQER